MNNIWTPESCMKGLNEDEDFQARDEIFVIGSGLERGEVDVDNKFVLHTKSKLSRNLSISVEGPSKAELSFMVLLLFI